MIGEFLVSLMTLLSGHVESDQDQLDQMLVLVDHDDNLQISFRDHFIGKIIVLGFYLLLFFIHNPLVPYFYSGYLRGHGLKYQNVLFPNGMVAGVFGTSLSHNDVGVLNMSRLTCYLEEVLHPEYSLAGGLLPALYGDSIFMNLNHSTILSKYEVVGTEEEKKLIRKLNFSMSGIRQSIEHMYGQLFNLFQLLQTK